MARAQISLEFVILISIAFLVGVVFLSSAAQLFQQLSERQRIAAMDDVGYQVQDELIIASTVTDGYHRSFSVPDAADRFAYSLTATATSLTLRSGAVVITYDLPEHAGDLVKGTNTVHKDGSGVWLS